MKDFDLGQLNMQSVMAVLHRSVEDTPMIVTDEQTTVIDPKRTEPEKI